jgi:hypothetical protein
MRRGERGQAAVMLVGILLVVVIGGLLLGVYARAMGVRSDEQRAADLAALAGARALRDAYSRVFEIGPSHLSRAQYEAIGRRVAGETAARNGAPNAVVDYPNPDVFAPVVIRVRVDGEAKLPAGRSAHVSATAEAELMPGASPIDVGPRGEGAYQGPLVFRQGKGMRPDVARAFDRMSAAAQADGVGLIINSAFRSYADQARLWAQRPDPKWTARPGTSLHRLGTELDLGPATAQPWLAANAKRFHFVQRYAWEPWHYGFVLNAGSASVGFGGKKKGAVDGASGSAIPGFVPDRFAPMLASAAQRWNVSAALLAAQIHQESGFNPAARSPAGAQGIAQFMPGTARSYGLRNPFDPKQSIDAQAHMMRDLLRQFGDVRLALAAYNAGSGAVATCMCVPPIPETIAYVASIIGLLHGAGDVMGTIGLTVRLVS